jgi:hypothetical protein
MNEGYLLLEDSFKDYKLKVQIEDGETVWYSNGVAIMYGGINLSDCYQVTVAEFDGVNNNILVAGLGHGNTSEIACQFGKVTTVEILETVLDLYEARVSDYEHSVVIDDFYDFIDDTKETYNGILMQLDFPGIESDIEYCLKSNERMYTAEFMTKIRDTLNESGVFVTEGLVNRDEDSPITKMLEEVGFEVEEWRQDFDRELIKGCDAQHILWKCTKTQN